MTHDDLLEPFLLEARELIARAAGELARLDRDPADREALEGLFRTVHTLKGSTALIDLTALTRLLHAAESRLETARADGVLGDAERLAAVLDVVEAWVEDLEGGREPPAALTARAQALGRELEGAQAPPSQALEASAAWAMTLTADVAETGPLVAIRYAPSADAYFRGEDPLALMAAIPDLLKLEVATPTAADPQTYDPFRCDLVLHAVSGGAPEAVRAAMRLLGDEVEIAVVAAAAVATRGLQVRALHVEADRLDDVAALVDELVIAKNALAHENRRLLAATIGSAAGRDLLNREAAVERVVGDLHAAVTALRLTPLAQLFARFPRQVREIAAELGKQVEMRMSGEATVLDKAVVEGLFEPLLHLLRNSLDHGIEAPAARRAAGKPERAAVTLAAETRGSEVVIEVADDGRGLDVDALRAAAVARGVLDAAEAAALSDAEAADLIFAPGFSTAARVSDLSGRGVGMDAVRNAVVRLGGSVTVDNRPGQGLAVRLSLPSKVRLQKALVVHSGGQRFAAPLEAILETHRVRVGELTPVREGVAYVRRDQVIPVLRLDDRLGLSRSSENPSAFPVLNVVVGGERIGFRVDAVGERIEAPLRPLDGLMTGFPGVLGTILEGDGQVLLVLDLAEVAA